MRISESAPTSGLIPARAGSTFGLWFVTFIVGAHPRPCGEHTAAEHQRRMESGSSPPVRGALPDEHRQNITSGLIPARAGSTWGVGGGMPRGRAHPRPCGEHINCSAIKVTELGSSPPVRGALWLRSRNNR